MASSKSWKKIFDDYNILDHDFKTSPFLLTSEQIKVACQEFTETSQKEVRILCKQDTRESRPKVFKENDLFILPIKNGVYNIVQGEGYIDIPKIDEETKVYTSKLDFVPETVSIGNSEMQHLDFAYAASLIRTFMDDASLILTIRGRKYSPEFSFKVGSQEIQVKGVQTEVDAGYEGVNKIVLVEAKNTGHQNVNIRQIYYPYRQWSEHTSKKVYLLFFDKQESEGENIYSIYQYEFRDIKDFNSIRLTKSGKFRIIHDI